LPYSALHPLLLTLEQQQVENLPWRL